MGTDDDWRARRLKPVLDAHSAPVETAAPILEAAITADMSARPLRPGEQSALAEKLLQALLGDEADAA